MLYVVATPIGNLQDVSHRALETLRTVDMIAAEDTRVTKKLLNHYQIHTPVVSSHQHNERGKSGYLVERMLNENIDVALVTDAGTPAISDPGAYLVAEAARQGVEVVPIPGPSAAVAAVSISGFENMVYTFFGFLPRAKKDCVAALHVMRGHHQSVVLYESPHRIIQLMENVQAVYPGALCTVSCDLTKLYEKTLRGSVETVLEQLKNNPKTNKGEYVVVLDLSAFPAQAVPATGAETLEAQLVDAMVQKNLSLRQAMEALIQAGQKKNAVYAASLHLKQIMIK